MPSRATSWHPPLPALRSTEYDAFDGPQADLYPRGHAARLGLATRGLLGRVFLCNCFSCLICCRVDDRNLGLSFRASFLSVSLAIGLVLDLPPCVSFLWIIHGYFPFLSSIAPPRSLSRTAIPAKRPRSTVRLFEL